MATPAMPQFSRRTILAATDLMADWRHTGITRFLREYGRDETVHGYSRADRANALGKHLIRNPEALSDDGECLTDAVVTKLIEYAIRGSYVNYPEEFSIELFRRHTALHRGLERDGFTVEGGQLRRALPVELD